MAHKMAVSDHSPYMLRHLLVTGRPGVGKTTLVKQVVDHFVKEGIAVSGFYTEEVRDGNGSGKGGQRSGPRVGFDVVNIKGRRGQLARIGGRGPSSQPMVGKYSVCLHSFEEVALPALCVVQSMAERVGADKVAEKGVHGVVKRTPVLMVIDEIGKMELFSHKFESEVRLLFDQPDVVILATVPVQSKHKSLLLVDQLISRKDVNLYEINESNRESAFHSVSKALKDSLHSRGKA